MSHLSLTERDRRWTAVREAMERDGVDCVVTPPSARPGTASQAESRYLTCCGGTDSAETACVFPLIGDVTAVASPRCLLAQDWVTDVRDPRGAPGHVVAERLAEASLPHRRVGIVGLGRHLSAPDGTAPHSFVRALADRFTDVEWIDYTAPFQAIRAVKSDEEIEYLAAATACVETAFERVGAVARPGVRDLDVWGAAMGALCRAGSEVPGYCAWGSGLRPQLFALPTHATLHRGHLIVAQLEASTQGYRSRGEQAFAVQDCDAVYRDLFVAYPAYWQGCLDALQVGRTLGEAAERCASLAATIVPAGDRYKNVTGSLTLHGLGLGGDLPLFRSGAVGAAAQHEVIVPGWTFTLVPTLEVEAAGRAYRIGWGDAVVATTAGPRRLGHRPVGLVMAPGDPPAA